MRILYISRENAPGDHGGAVHTWQVAYQLARKGHEVLLLCHKLPGEPSYEEREGVRIFRTPMRVAGRRLPIMGLPALLEIPLRSCAAVIERFDTFGGLGAFVAQRQRRPLLLEVNYPHLEEMVWKWRQRKSRLAKLGLAIRALRRWNRWQFDRASAIVAPRASIVPEPHRDKVELVHWGADVEVFRPLGSTETEALRRELRLGADRVVVLHGSFQPWHGLSVIPEIVARVTRRNHQVTFLFIGEGPGLQGLEQRLAQIGARSRCRFLRCLPHPEIPSCLALSDVALAPFDTEAYPPLKEFGFFWSPAKIFEAMASGVPVVSTDQDYFRRVVQDRGAGLCAREGDAEGLASAVLEILADDGRRQRMRRAARDAVEQSFSWQVHARQLSALLERMVPEERSAPEVS